MSALPLLGVPCGVVIGCLKNQWNTGSIYSKPKWSQSPKIVRVISITCEILRFNARSLEGLAAKLLVVEMLPLCLVVIENVGQLILTSQLPLKEAAWLAGKRFVQLTGRSSIYIIPLMAINYIFLFTIKAKFTRNGIDPSGHAITACVNTFIRFQILNVINQAGLFSPTYLLFATAMGLAEGVWVYETTINYHSTADMVAGCALAALSLGTYASSIYACSNISLNHIVSYIL